MDFLRLKSWLDTGANVSWQGKSPHVLYWVLAAAILVGAACVRFSLPQTPLMDPDTWGYLNPGFSKLTGGFFQHTFGRNFVYPGFIFGGLCVWGDFEVLGVMQHALGLLSGILLLVTWNLLCGFLRTSRPVALAARFMGLGLTAQYLFNRSQIVLEHTIRPESIFPCFLILSFVLNFAALRSWLLLHRERRAGLLLGFNLFVTYVGMSLKPSMAFGAAAANLPLLFWLWRGTAFPRHKAAVTGAALAVTLLTLWLPEKILAQKDAFTTFFLPTMLFTIHAPIIHEQMVEDLQHGEMGPYPLAWLQTFNQGFERSLAGAQDPANGVWNLLGLNADYLIYRDSVFDATFEQGPQRERQIAAFCMYYYWRTWKHRPGEMLAKIGRQLRFAYSANPTGKLRFFLNKTHRRKIMPMPFLYPYREASLCSKNPTVHPRLMASIYGVAYTRRLHNLGQLKTPFPQSLLMADLNNVILPVTYLPLLIVAVGCGAALLILYRAVHATLIGGVVLCVLVNFGMFLTVAVAHTLDIRRYVDNQHILLLLTAYAAVLLPVQFFFAHWKSVPVTPLEPAAAPPVP